MTKVILGGGLSGLSAAYYLSKLSGGETITLLESTSSLGGWIKSEKVDKEVVFEQAPRTIRCGGAAGIHTLNLVDELSLSLDIVPISRENVAARNRLIYAKGELHMLPTTPFSLLTTHKPFSKSILKHILQDLTTKPKFIPDESAYEFTKRRFGSEIADYLIDSLICGICAGNSKEVSVNFIMKKMFQYEQNDGGVIKGFLKHLFDKKEKLPTLGLLAARSKIEKWNIYTFRDGMQILPIALESALRSGGNTTDIQLNSECKEITFSDSGNTLICLKDGKIYEANHVISSIPAKKLAPLVQNQHPQLADKLSKTKTVTVGVVNLLYNGDLIKNPAFGFLVPPKEKLPILGVIYDSCCKNYRNKTVLTVMMGGYWFQDLFGDNPSKDTLLHIARDNLKTILGINEQPVYSKVSILKDCIPQYVVGHEQKLGEINGYIKDRKLPISLCGASYYGVGVNDVIMSAKNAVLNCTSQTR